MAAYAAVIQPGDTIMGLDLAHGGHLTHGHKLSFSGKHYRVVSYGVTRETETLDYDEMEAIAVREQPKLLIGGGSAYPRTIDFARMRQIADKVGAIYLVDMAHFAGLVAGGAHPSPVPHAHIITTTTHKTLRGPRSGMILRPGRARRRHRQVGLSRMPGRAAGAHRRGQGRLLPEALQPSFKDYAAQVIANAKVLAQRWPMQAIASSPAAPTPTSCWSMFSARACSATRPRRRSAWPASRSTRTPSPLT